MQNDQKARIKKKNVKTQKWESCQIFKITCVANGKPLVSFNFLRR